MTTLKLISDLYNLALTVGLVFLLWSIVTKYELHYKIIYGLKRLKIFRNSDLEVCVLCVTFWGCYLVSGTTGVFIGKESIIEALSYSVLRAVVALPVVIHSIKHQFDA